MRFLRDSTTRLAQAASGFCTSNIFQVDAILRLEESDIVYGRGFRDLRDEDKQ
ncbi:transposase [Metarhizium brunneum]